MNEIELALSALRKEPDTEARNNALEPFAGICLHCCTEEALLDIKGRLFNYLSFYGFSKIAEILKD